MDIIARNQAIRKKIESSNKDMMAQIEKIAEADFPPEKEDDLECFRKIKKVIFVYH